MPPGIYRGAGGNCAAVRLTYPGAVCLIKTQLFGSAFPAVVGWLPESANRLDPCGTRIRGGYTSLMFPQESGACLA